MVKTDRSEWPSYKSYLVQCNPFSFSGQRKVSHHQNLHHSKFHIFVIFSSVSFFSPFQVHYFSNYPKRFQISLWNAKYQTIPVPWPLPDHNHSRQNHRDLPQKTFSLKKRYFGPFRERDKIIGPRNSPKTFSSILDMPKRLRVIEAIFRLQFRNKIGKIVRETEILTIF